MSKENNPANSTVAVPDNYIPMSTGVMRLAVPQKEGYHRHWFRGTQERISRALQAGYKFVDKDDETVAIRNFDLGGGLEDSKGTDLGSRVSVVSGDDVDSHGQPGRLYLMECPTELFNHAQKILEARNESIAQSIRGGTLGAGQGGENRTDAANRYIDASRSNAQDILTPKRRS